MGWKKVAEEKPKHNDLCVVVTEEGDCGIARFKCENLSVFACDGWIGISHKMEGNVRLWNKLDPITHMEDPSKVKETLKDKKEQDEKILNKKSEWEDMNVRLSNKLDFVTRKQEQDKKDPDIKSDWEKMLEILIQEAFK